MAWSDAARKAAAEARRRNSGKSRVNRSFLAGRRAAQNSSGFSPRQVHMATDPAQRKLTAYMLRKARATGKGRLAAHSAGTRSVIMATLRNLGQ